MRSLLTRLPAAAWLLAGFFFCVSPVRAQFPIASVGALQTSKWQLETFGSGAHAEAELSAVPSAQAARMQTNDPWLLIENGGTTITVLDASRMVRLRTQASEQALTGDIAISADDRVGYLGDEAGGINRYALPELRLERRVPTGIRITAFALSGDGRWLLAATREPDGLWLFDQNLQPVRSYPLTTLDGKSTGQVASIQPNLPRSSLIVTLRDLNELWEISWNRQAEPIFDGLVHDYRMGEGLASSGFLGVRRTPLQANLPQVVLSPGGLLAIGTVSTSAGKPQHTEVIHLDIRRRITTLPPIDATTAITFLQGAHERLAAVDAGNQLQVRDVRTGLIVHTLPLTEPATTLRHASTATGAGLIWVVSCTAADGICRAGATDPDAAPFLLPVQDHLRKPVRIGIGTPGQAILIAGSGPDATLFAFDATTLQAAGQISIQSLRGLHSLARNPPQ